MPDLLEVIEAADAIDLDFLLQDFPKLVKSVHEGVQIVHRKIEALSQAAI
jgi:hypothetical protein